MTAADLPSLTHTRRFEVFPVLMHTEAEEVHIRAADGVVYSLPLVHEPEPGIKQAKKQELVQNCLAEHPDVFWLFYEIQAPDGRFNLLPLNTEIVAQCGGPEG